MTPHEPSENNWRHRLRQAWQRRGVLACGLWPLSWGYGFLVWLRRRLYRRHIWRSHRLPVPVIIVGNVLAGGVGKTPIVIALVEHCLRAGRRVGVISRGHGRRDTEVREVLPGADARDVGDEPLLIARRTGAAVWVGADRAAAAQALLQAHPTVDLIISDDGLQHLALARDLELCVFDERGIGNGWLLPAGPLREPWPRPALPGVPCVLLLSVERDSNPTPPMPWAPTTQSHPPVHRIERRLSRMAYRADGAQRDLSTWHNQSVQALAAIAKPERFFSALQQQGLILHKALSLPDHATLDDVHIDASDGDCLCTEKDAVKLWSQHPEVWAVPLDIELPAHLRAEIDHWLQAHPQRHRHERNAPL